MNDQSGDFKVARMSQEILPDLHVIEVPLPGNPLKSINSYVVTSKDRNLVIDTGMLRPECKTALSSGLEELGVDLASTDFFITHSHADHMGLISDLATESSTVFFNQLEAEYVAILQNSPSRVFERLTERARKFGFSQEEIEQALQRHPGFKYSPPAFPSFEILGDGAHVQVGRYTFLVVATPGHTPGHLCLYEPARKLLISGDHILGDITPNITVWPDVDDSLGDYLMSLDKVAQLEVDLVLPGHRRPITDCGGRIEQLKSHHRQRLDEVSMVLRLGMNTVYEVASCMTWDIVAESWAGFPIVQKWFATSEAVSHLRYLERRGFVTRSEVAGVLRFGCA